MKLNAHGDGYFLIDEEDIQENISKRNSMKDIINNQSKLILFIHLSPNCK